MSTILPRGGPTSHVSPCAAGAADPVSLEPRARLVVDKMAIALQASCLLQHGNPLVAEAFCAARLPRDNQLPATHYGSQSVDLGSSIVQTALIDRLNIFS